MITKKKEWITTKELAEIKGIGDRAVRKYVQDNKYVVRKTSKSYEFLVTSLEENVREKITGLEEKLTPKIEENCIVPEVLGLTWNNIDFNDKTVFIKQYLYGENITVQVGYVQNFTENYLDTLHFLLKQAKKNNKDICVFTYTLPIIITSICFLESNINNLIGLFNSSNNIIDYHSKNRALTKNICDDFIQLDKTPLLQKYYIILKYYRDIDISSEENKYYSKVTTVISLRNLLVHDKAYSIMPTKGDKDKIVKLLENQKWIKPNNNLSGIVPPWLPYLSYESVCYMVKAIFEFYINYSKLLIPDQEPVYQNKIERIISWHTLLEDIEGITHAK